MLRIREWAFLSCTFLPLDGLLEIRKWQDAVQLVSGAQYHIVSRYEELVSV